MTKSYFPAEERAAFPSLYFAIVPDAMEVARSMGYATPRRSTPAATARAVAAPAPRDDGGGEGKR